LWFERVAALAANRTGRQFTSTDPGGDQWWHTAIIAGDGVLVVGRPSSTALAPWRELVLIVGGLSAVFAVGCGLALIMADRRVGGPLRLLADAGDQLRVRGRVHDELRRRMVRLGPAPVELRRLADNFADLEADFDQTERRMAALAGAGASLGASLDQRTVLDRTLEHLEHLLGVERTAIIRYDPRIERFEVVAARGHGPAYQAELSLRADDPTMPSVRSLTERTPIQISDSEAEVAPQALRDRGRRHGYRSVLAVPLTDELEQPTVLLLHDGEPRTYSYDEVELSQSFAAIAGAALRNAELFESTDARLRSQTSRLEAIVGSVDEGLLVTDVAGRLLFVNPVLRSRLPSGVTFEEGMQAGRFLDEILSHCASADVARAEIDRLEPGGDGHYDVTLDELPGEAAVTYRVRSFAVRDSRGRQVGRGQTWRDISRALDLERMKNGLLAAVSHEFRTPLALIKGYASTLLADDVTWNEGDQREFLELVGSEADRLADLVKRILDMRRIDAGMVTLQRIPTTVTEVVGDAVRALPHERDRIVVGELPMVSVDIDQTRIVTALRNLLENACKYSPPDGPVTVSAGVDDGALVLAIRDRGPGVPPWLRDEVFETFVRADPGLDAAQGGIGLGLAIAKGFVEAHGGRITIDDPPGDEPGSVFSVTLPLAAGADRVEQVPVVHLPINEEMEMGVER
jgi:signal transduction histidine kinase